MIKKNRRIKLPVFVSWCTKAFKALTRYLAKILREAVGAWFLQLKYGRTILDASFDIHKENQKLLYASRMKALAAGDKREVLLPQASLDPSKCILFGNQFLLIDQTEGHFLALGVPGSAKTLITYASVAHTLTLPNRRVVLLDPKNDMRGILHAQNISYSYFNTSAKDSVRWDIAKDANSPNKLIQLASILLPEEKNNTDSFWLRASRRLLVAIMSVFLHKFGECWTFHDAIKASRLPKEELITFLRQYPDNEILIECLFSEEVEKASANVRLDFIMHLDKLVPAAIHSQQATKSFSVSDFMKGEGVLLFGMDITEDEASKPLLHAVFNTLVNYINALPDKPPIRTFLYIEESYFLGEMPGLAKLIAFGRSKNAIVWLVLQCVSGFYKIYDENLAEFILSLCRHVIALRSTPKTAKYLSSLFGTVRIFKRSISDSLSQSGLSGGDQVREESTPKFLDSTFLNIDIPSKEKGLTGFFITPDSVEEKHISGEEVERLKAKRVPVPPDEPISKENQILLPWTAEEKKKFVYGEYTKGGENDGINTLNDFIDKEGAEYLVEFARKFVEEFKNGKEECN